MTERIPVDQDNQHQVSEEEVEQPIANRLKRGSGVAFYAEADSSEEDADLPKQAVKELDVYPKLSDEMVTVDDDYTCMENDGECRIIGLIRDFLCSIKELDAIEKGTCVRYKEVSKHVIAVRYSTLVFFFFARISFKCFFFADSNGEI